MRERRARRMKALMEEAIGGAMEQNLHELARRINYELLWDQMDVGTVAEKVAEQYDVRDMAEHFHPSRIAQHLDLNDVAYELDLSDLAYEVDLSDLADHINVSEITVDENEIARKMAENIDVSDVAKELDETLIADALASASAALTDTRINALVDCLNSIELTIFKMRQGFEGAQ